MSLEMLSCRCLPLLNSGAQIYKISYYSTFYKEILSSHAHFPMVTEDCPFAVAINNVIRGLQEFIMKSPISRDITQHAESHHHANNHGQRINTESLILSPSAFAYYSNMGSSENLSWHTAQNSTFCGALSFSQTLVRYTSVYTSDQTPRTA